MSISSPFIHRPVATTLLTVAIALAGAVAFQVLPVSALPQIDFPTISVGASLPGASPEIMASSVATPLERQFGRIAGVTEMTSSSFLGTTSITLQFDLNRNIDGAARDVEASINAARSYLPANLPSNPTYRKVNPADAPIMILALTSKVYDRGPMYDAASTIMQQRLSQIQGVGQVSVGGSSLPAVRVEVNPTQLNSYGLGLQDVNSMLSSQNANVAKGQITDGQTTADIVANDQLLKADYYKDLVVGYHNGAAIKLSDIADVHDAVENIRATGFLNGKPCMLLIVFRQPGANIIDTVDRIRDALPSLEGFHSRGNRLHHRARSDHHDPRVGARCRTDPGHLHRPGDSGRFRLSAECARHPDPQRGRSGFADRHLRRDVPVWLQHRQSFADGADHLHRLRGGRRHRGDRKHYALSRAGHDAPWRPR